MFTFWSVLLSMGNLNLDSVFGGDLFGIGNLILEFFFVLCWVLWVWFFRFGGFFWFFGLSSFDLFFGLYWLYSIGLFWFFVMP
jgi:hypothetical protein